jgi:hypothetical protein
MQIDRQISLWGGWIAGPAFGVAMMAAPEYLHLGPVWSGLLFWGGIGVFVVTVIIVTAISVHDEKDQRKMLWPILTMAVGLLLFCVGAAWYFGQPRAEQLGLPTAEIEPGNSEKKPWKHTLEDLYKTDFNLLSLEQPILTLAKNDSNGLNIMIESKLRIWYDFASRVDFIAVYIPPVRDSRIEVMQLINAILDRVPELYSKLKSDISAAAGAPGVAMEQSANLIFSGRVFLYTDNSISIIDLGKLTEAYEKKGIHIQMRGYDYWFANKDR